MSRSFVSASISANTTFAPTISTTFAQATKVQAGIIISSDGFSFNDNKILITPLVQELVKIANFLLNLFKVNEIFKLKDV